MRFGKLGCVIRMRGKYVHTPLEIGASHFMTRDLACSQRENLLRQTQMVVQVLDEGGRCVRITS